jgi:DNA-binding LacI/PurR family transcriptional regulator
MATIQDIAKRAGVSSATVSRVINNSGYVSAETRKIVNQAVNELNYVPNRQAQNLRRGATKNLGIVTTSLTATVMARVESFMQFAHDAGYTTTLFNTNGNPQREIEALERLKGKELDGIFLIYRANEWSDIEYYLLFGPIVTLHNIDNVEIDIPSVFIDHYEGYQMILEDLWENGARSYLNLFGLSTGVNTKRRIHAYRDFCKKHQLTPHEIEPYLNIFDEEDTQKIIQNLENQTELPDAIIAHSDQLASFLVSHFQKQKLKMPEDVAIVGFDNLIISRLMNFTSVDYAIEEQGRNACRLLLNDLEKEHYEPVPLEFKLIKRGTTK